ncbi:threonine/homoserine/homoserine lactone efflux protein [Nonomuraea thailandensis]|uniref:Threonine/homoserine/homoserine lactone efflux protein n=1 Tax=Nonomuraea thailandensis TaxID=1188745 RepID=A0A9X2GHB5_9ACTN|nr:LysE family translocator [Nonomuraea thailandensis]MCP2357514.1 threonine/homoserine/homoserine lactone efflux protein [Nonomuraea thailandensis]
MLSAMIAFAVASLLVSMIPGPTTVVILRQSIRSGRSAGVATVLGNETGWLLWCLAAAFGLSALLLVSELAFDVMRIAGALVLVWFGARMVWQAWRGPSGSRPGSPPAPPPAAPSLWSCYRSGLLTNLANPKAGVFALSFLPQFVPEGAPAMPALLLLAVASTLIDLVWYLGIVRLVVAAERFFRRPAVRRCLEYVSGTLLIGLAVRLALTSRP